MPHVAGAEPPPGLQDVPRSRLQRLDQRAVDDASELSAVQQRDDGYVVHPG
jgi:hypothetical protein